MQMDLLTGIRRTGVPRNEPDPAEAASTITPASRAHPKIRGVEEVAHGRADLKLQGVHFAPAKHLEPWHRLDLAAGGHHRVDILRLRLRRDLAA